MKRRRFLLGMVGAMLVPGAPGAQSITYPGMHCGGFVRNAANSAWVVGERLSGCYFTGRSPVEIRAAVMSAVPDLRRALDAPAV